VWQQDIGVFPVHFTDQGDEWCHHLTVSLTGDYHMTARGTNGTDPVELGPPPGGPVYSKLLVRPHADGISCTVTGDDGDSVSADQVEPWRRAADTAVSLLGCQNRVFAWEAIIGTAAQTFGLDRLGPLEEPQDFGPVHLASGGICMREQVSTERIGASGIRHSFPLVASGECTTYVWDRAAQIAELCLRRTCALLSLVTGAVWIPRSHPVQVTGEVGAVRVPPVFGHVPPLPGEAGGTGWSGGIPADIQPFRLPGWAAQAWPLLGDDRDLARALNAVYEGMRLEQQHPSLAHLTFVAAIEGFGARFVSDAPCDCSPGCTHRKNVAQKRFRKALKTVMTNREVEEIWQIAYTLRSFTGHSGTLFGSENTYGYSHYGSLFDTADDAVFDYVILGQLRNASRRVVAKAVGRPG
jgi:hypothetical protein